MDKQYTVVGEFNGKEIETTVNANSERSAKMKAGIINKIPRSELQNFVNSSDISVE